MRKQQNTMLKSARIQKCWTAEFVSGQVGVSLNTYMRWETGAQTPRHSSLDALCKIFEMSPEELGFAELLTPGRTMIAAAPSSEQSKTQQGRVEAQEQPITTEILATWTQEIASCWQFYFTGGQAKLERLLPGYLANLVRPTLYPGPDQKTAAGLTSQVYQLIALLDLQRGDFVSAQTNGTQAVVYSQLSKDWNVYIAAQVRLASIFSARKRVGSTLSAYNDALRRINAGYEAVSPILHSWIFAGLAEIQASMGREKEALQLMKLAVTVFPDDPENDPCFTYAQCDRSMLYLYEGLVFLKLGQAKVAWDAFAQVDELKPAPPERIRAEFLKQKAYTSLILGNMIQTCIYLEAAAKAAQAIQSDLAFSEVFALFEHALALWGQEPRVKALSRLFQR